MQIIEFKQGIKASTGLNWNGVKYFSTWRINGFSENQYASLNFGLHMADEKEAVLQNRALLRRSLPSDPVWLNQVHGNKAIVVGPQDRSNIASADAMITQAKNLPLAIMTADCMPIVLASLDASVLAVVHAGWRGLASGVLENTVKTMFDLAGTKAMQAWIGPAIAADVFEVGAEVKQEFLATDSDLGKFFVAQPQSEQDNKQQHDDERQHDYKQRYLCDLPGIANHKFLKLGALLVENSSECTYKKKERYFSYRRDGETGRQVTMAWLG